MTIDRLYRVQHVGVCGSSKDLPKAAAELCRAIGRRLAREENVAIVNGGTKRRNSALGADNYAAEWFVVSAAEREIPRERVADRIVTVINDDDGSRTTRFRIGSAQSARGKTSEARRISFVRGLDALIAIGGSEGTRQELALAIEFRIPILPVPGFEGAAQEVWEAYRSELVAALRIVEKRARSWEAKAIGRSFKPQPLADEMVGTLLKSLPKRCFVIMPFRTNLDDLYDLIIEPAIVEAGDLPLRVDRVGVPGNVTTQVENGLRNCDYAIAVLDCMTPNVLYELGAAHALGKRVILVKRQDTLGNEGVPFDIYTQQRIEYTELDATFLARLSKTVRNMSTPRQ